MDCLIKFVIRLNILLVKKVLLQIVLIIILERSELIHIIFRNFIILIKSVVNNNKNKYYNIFLEKVSYKDK